MDYVKEMELLRKRNSELMEKNRELQNKVYELEERIDSQKKDAEHVNDLKKILADAIDKYDVLVSELSNYKAQYQIKFNELQTTLMSIRSIKETNEEMDEYLKLKISEAI